MSHPTENPNSPANSSPAKSEDATHGWSASPKATEPSAAADEQPPASAPAEPSATRSAGPSAEEVASEEAPSKEAPATEPMPTEAAPPQDAPTPPKADRHPQPQSDAPASSSRSSAPGDVGSFAVVPTVIPRGSVGYLHRITYVLAVAAAFGLAPLSTKLGTTVGAIALVVLGISLALAASASINATAVIGGSLGALASGMLLVVSPALAGGVLVGLCFAERTGRVEGAWARLVHVALALSGGALAGVVTANYESAEPGVRVVAIIVAAVLAALPLFVDADDPRAHALDDLAEQVPEPARRLLRQGAMVCRAADESVLDRSLREQVRKSWQKLLELGHARARIARNNPGPSNGLLRAAGMEAQQSSHGRAVARRLDDQIAEHVAALTRAYTAVDAARAAELSLDDAAMRNVKNTGENLEHVAEAIVEEA